MRWWEHVLATQATDTLATSSSARASAESCQVDMPDRCLYRRAATSSWDETHSMRSRSPLRAANQEDKAVGEPAPSDLSAGRPCQRGCRAQLSRTDRGRDSTRSSTSHVLAPRTRNSDRPGPPRRFGMRTQPPQENVTDDNALRPSACSTHVCTRKPPRAMNCSGSCLEQRRWSIVRWHTRNIPRLGGGLLTHVSLDYFGARLGWWTGSHITTISKQLLRVSAAGGLTARKHLYELAVVPALPRDALARSTLRILVLHKATVAGPEWLPAHSTLPNPLCGSRICKNQSQ